MAYFRSFFGGNEGGNEEQTGTEMVENLVQRLETCTDPEDRRDALRTLRSMAKKLRVAVGSMGMNAFMEVLEKERSNDEMLKLTLEVLNCILSSEDETTDDDDLGERFAEVILKKPIFMPSLIASVEKFEFGVRRSAIQLLTSLLRHRGPEVQSSVMGQARGVPCLIDSVHDTREVVRNEAVLMLCELSRNNSQIQQLLAYDNAFVLLLEIIESESLDSIVIEDCLFVILNLLRKNSMNQQLFRENNLIVRLNNVLSNFLHGSDDEPEGVEWSKQRTANLIFLLQIVRSLVSPDNVGTNTHAAQKIIYQCKMLASLCRVLLSETGVSMEVLTESIIAVAECIRGNYANQEYFASCNLSTGENFRPALLVLLISMTAEKQPFKLRCAVFYAFLAYLNENEFGKTKIVETLLSSTDSGCSTGGMICQALSASESVQSWFGNVSLLHCLLDVPHLREQLMRVQITVVADDPPVSLLSHVSNQLVSYGNRKVQARAGLLMLLCTWLTDCPSAVSTFSANQDAMQYLSTQIVDECGEGSESEQQVVRGLMAFLLLSCLQATTEPTARRALEQLVDRRVGRDHIVTCLEGVSRTEQFVRAAQKPQPLAKAPTELCLDFHFIRLFKSREGSLLKLVKPNGEYNGTSNNEGIIQSYKELIKRQDEDLAVLKQDLKRTLAENETLKKEVATASTGMDQEIENLRLQLQKSTVQAQSNEQTQLQIQEMHRVNEQWRSEAEKYKQWAQQWQQYQLAQLPNPQDTVIAQLQLQVQQVEQQLAYGYDAFEQHSRTTEQYAAELAELRRKHEEAVSSAAAAQVSQVVSPNGHNEVTDLEKLRCEQEDLLVLLADQHNKLNSYKNRLRQLGENVTDDEDDD